MNKNNEFVRRFLTTEKTIDGTKSGYEAIYILEDSPEYYSFIKQHNFDCVFVIKDQHAAFKQHFDSNDCYGFHYYGNCVEYDLYENKDSTSNNIFKYYQFFGAFDGIFMIEICNKDKDTAKRFIPKEDWVEVTYNKNYNIMNLYKKSKSEILAKIEKELNKKNKNKNGQPEQNG